MLPSGSRDDDRSGLVYRASVGEGQVVEQIWQPLHDGHSISDMALTLELDRLLDQSVLSEVVVRKETFPGLPALNVGRGFPIGIPGAAAQPWAMNPLGQPPIASVTFDRFTAAGTIAERFSVQSNAVAYATTEYTRWAAVSAKAYGYLSTVMPLLGDANVAAFTIVYTDKFVMSGDAEEGAWLSSLLRHGGALVAPAVTTADGFAHSHIGFFDTVASMPALVNVNFNMEDQQGVGRVAVILSFIRVILTTPIGCRDADFGAEGPLTLIAQEAHLLGKKLLHGVVTDDIASRIGLKLP